MATKLNEKVAMGLKQWTSRWILHIIDMWSRYILSIFIDRKKPSNVIDNFYDTLDREIWSYGSMNDGQRWRI